MKLLIYLFICNSMILFSQPDSTWESDSFIWPGIDFPPKIIGSIESIQNRLIYPPDALERSIEGDVYVLVNIDSLGNLNKASLIKGIGVGCDEEAIRLAKTARFSPAYDNGKYINCQTVIRVRFRLPNNE